MDETENNLAEMLPCPFCGQKPELQQDKRYPNHCNRAKDAYCVVCDTIGCPAYRADNTYFLSAQAAIKKWNKRAKQTSLMDKWTELREEIQELHENNADKPDVENVTKYLLNFISVLDEGDDTHD